MLLFVTFNTRLFNNLFLIYAINYLIFFNISKPNKFWIFTSNLENHKIGGNTNILQVDKKIVINYV